MPLIPIHWLLGEDVGIAMQWSRRSVVGEACEERSSHGLEHSHTEDFWPRPPENLLPLERMWLRLPPPPPFFSSLPSRPLSHETVRRQALSLLCSHARLCVARNLISICTLCSIHVLSMLLRADRTAMASQLMNVWCSSSNTPIRLDLVLLVSSRFHLSESPSCAIYTTISLLAGKNKKHTHDHDHDTCGIICLFSQASHYLG